MRKELGKIENVRDRFTATFERFGSKRAYKCQSIITLLFVEVKNKSGEVVADHVWFTQGLQFERLNLQCGDKVCFDARVKKYEKGYRGRRDVDDKPITTDYKLSHPTNVVKHQVDSQPILF